MPYPSPTDNGLMLGPVAVYTSLGYRGYYPGLRMSPQLVNAAFSTGDTVLGTGTMAGKKLKVMKTGALVGGGVLFIDHISDWRV